MSNSIDIRRLGFKDASFARKTVHVVKRYGNPSETIPMDAAGMQAWLSRPSNILIAASENGVPVGFALGYLLDRVDKACSMLFFYEIEVASPYRRRGIGRCLVEAMKAIAREQQVPKMWVQTNPDNIAAWTLYRSAGGVESASSDLLYVWTDMAFSDFSAPFFLK